MLPLLFALLLAADESPKDLPKERQEEASREMLAFQAAELRTVQAQRDEVEATKRLRDYMDRLRKEFHADGCDLSMDKKWICPPKPKESSK